MAISNFLQDEGAPIGSGVFQTDDGRAFRAYSPADAAPFLQPPAPSPDMRVAEAQPQAPLGYQMAGLTGEAPPAPAPVATDYPVGSPTDIDLDVPAPKNAPPRPASPPAPLPPPQGQEGTGTRQPMPPAAQAAPTRPEYVVPQYKSDSDRAREAQQAAAEMASAERQYGAQPVAAMPGATPKGMVAKTATRQYEDAGVPYTHEEQQQYAAVEQASRVAHLKTAMSQIAQADADTIRAQGEAQKWGDAVRERNNERENEINQYVARKTAIEDEVDKASRREIDPGRFYHKTGVLGVIASAVAQGLGAYGASLGHSPNYAAQIIDSHVQRDVAAQVDQVQRLGAQANNKLARLMKDHDMSLNEATFRLTQAQRQLGDAVALQVASAHRSAGVVAQYQQWDADRKKQFLDEEHKRLGESVGKSKGTITYGAPAGDGGGGNGYLGTMSPNRAGYEADMMRMAEAHPDEGREQWHARLVSAAKGKALGGGGDSAPLPRGLAGTAIKEFQAEKTGERLKEGYELGDERPGFLESKYKQLKFAVKSAFAQGRKVDKTMYASELASLANPGTAPSDDEKKHWFEMLDTNDPGKIYDVIEKAKASGKAFREGLNKVTTRGIQHEQGYIEGEAD